MITIKENLDAITNIKKQLKSRGAWTSGPRVSGKLDSGETWKVDYHLPVLLHRKNKSQFFRIYSWAFIDYSEAIGTLRIGFYYAISYTSDTTDPTSEQMEELDNYVPVINKFIRDFARKYKLKIIDFLTSDSPHTPMNKRLKLEGIFKTAEEFEQAKIIVACDEFLNFFETLRKTNKSKFLSTSSVRRSRL